MFRNPNRRAWGAWGSGVEEFPFQRGWWGGKVGSGLVDEKMGGEDREDMEDI